MSVTPKRIPEPVVALHLVLADEQYRAMTAEDLLGLYLTGRDEAAFYALVRRYGPLVMRRCRATLGQEDLAQEAFQETFHRLVVQGRAIRRQGAVGRWLAATAHRRAMNIARRERRQRVRDLDSLPRPPVPEPSGTVAQFEAGRAVAQALAGLPERFRLPLELVYIDGLTHGEAATALQWPRGTLDSYVHRGLEKLRRSLRGLGIPAVAAAALLRETAQAVPPNWVQTVVTRAGGASSEALRVAPLLSPRAWTRRSRRGPARRDGGHGRRRLLAPYGNRMTPRR